MCKNERFLRACRREPVDATPVWLMRQAGRYMPAYRALREKHSLLEMIKAPDLATEVTLQPVRAFNIDAAIVFADILPLLDGMGLGLQFIPGKGPVFASPLRSAEEVKRIVVRPPEETLNFTLETIRQVKKELADKLPLIGFSGAPFTLACYAIEGCASKDFRRAALFRREQPRAWHGLMAKLAEAVGAYLRAQVEAGADALQLFDSWVGALGADEYREYVLPHTQRAIEAAREDHTGGPSQNQPHETPHPTQTGNAPYGRAKPPAEPGREGGTDSRVPPTPLIHFGTGTSHLLDAMKKAGGEVIGIDSHTDLKQAWDRLGPEVAVQGNLAPEVLLSSPEDIRREAARILDSVRGRRGHIFNLGHGVIKETPPEHVAVLVDFVHRHSASGH